MSKPKVYKRTLYTKHLCLFLKIYYFFSEYRKVGASLVGIRS